MSSFFVFGIVLIVFLRYLFSFYKGFRRVILDREIGIIKCEFIILKGNIVKKLVLSCY